MHGKEEWTKFASVNNASELSCVFLVLKRRILKFLSASVLYWSKSYVYEHYGYHESLIIESYKVYFFSAVIIF